MMRRSLTVGFVPLVDAAPLIVAQELGFASEEGLDLTLRPAPSWSTLRDQLAFGQVDAAHMLAPVPVAATLGLGPFGEAFDALAMLSVNGNCIGISRALADRMRDQGHDFDFCDAAKAGRALSALGPGPLRIGVPFPYSMHAELVHYWLAGSGVTQPYSVVTIPPPMIVDAMRAGEVDAFCLGEPWGSVTVEAGVAELLLPGAAIWAFAPEKVLATRAGWADQSPDLAHRLIRAIWRAARWLSDPASRLLTAEILSHPNRLNVPADLIEHALTGQFYINQRAESRQVTRFVEFFDGAATFPWRSQAEWIARRLAARAGIDQDHAALTGRTAFRSDLYRDALDGLAPNLPAASVKLEGAVDTPRTVKSLGGELILPRDLFFDGRIFEPFTG